MFNPQVVNPSFYGARKGVNLGVNYRHQWAKLEGQPLTITVFGDANLPQLHGGVGFGVSYEQLGAFTTTGFNLGYAYTQEFRKQVRLSIGCNAGALFSTLDGSKLVTPQGVGANLNDASLSNQQQKSIRPLLSVGISCSSKYLEAGLVYTNVINAKDKFEGSQMTLKPQYGGTLQVFIGSKVKLGSDFSIKPGFALTTDFKEFQTDISVLAGYKEYVMLGFNARGYNKRSFESLSPILRVCPVQNLAIIYGYDVSLGKLSNVNKGSHEITLNYVLPNNRIFKSPRIINNPRFL